MRASLGLLAFLAVALVSLPTGVGSHPSGPVPLPSAAEGPARLPPSSRSVPAGPASLPSGTWSDLNLTWPTFCGLTWGCGPALPGYALADQASAGKVVMTESVSRADTYNTVEWTFDQDNWSEGWQSGNPAYPPPFGSLVYDPDTGYILSYGGIWSPINDSTFVENSNQTWSLSASGYSQLSPAGSPPVPAGPSCNFDFCDHDLVWDAALGGALLLEEPASHGVYTETWVYRSGTWTNATTSPSPPGDANSQMVYDAADQEVLLFGGSTNDQGLEDNLTWVYAGGVWTNLTGTLAIAPPPGGAMAYDPALGEVILFDGNTWAFRSGGWQELPGGHAPSFHSGATMTFSSELGGLLLFGSNVNTGGIDAGVLNGTWLYHGTAPPARPQNWTPLGEFPALGPLDPQLVYDPAGGYDLLLGMDASECGGISCPETWTYDAGVWTNLSLPVDAQPWDAQIVYDREDGYVLAIALDPTTGVVSTWKFDAGSWTLLHPQRSPPYQGIFSVAMADDPSDGYVVALFSIAYNCGTFTGLRSETWSFLGGNWTNRTNPLLPSPARSSNQLAFDPVGGYVLEFGGIAQASCAPRFYPVGDTWTFQDGNWTNISGQLSGSPPSRYNFAMDFDPLLGGVVVFGGEYTYLYDVGQVYYNDTWLFGNGAWTNVTGTVAPSPRSQLTSTFDPQLNGTLLVGGSASLGTYNDSWCLDHCTIPTSGAQLVGASVSPAVATLGTGQSLSLQAGATCTPGRCPASVAYSWSLNNSLGGLGPSTGPTTAFTAGAAPGLVAIIVSVSLNGTTLTASAAVTIVSTKSLTGVAISPPSASVNTSAAKGFTAVPTCSPGACPASGLVFAWTLNNTLGVLTPTSGPSTTFAAGSSPGSSLLTVVVSWDGTTKWANSSISIRLPSSSPLLTGVSIAPLSASVPEGGTVEYGATATCSPSPCPAGEPLFVWSLNNTLATASPTSGNTTNVTAGYTVGLVSVEVNGSLGGVTLSAMATLQVIRGEVVRGASPASGSQPSYLWVEVAAGVGLVAVGTVVIYLYSRRRSLPPAPETEDAPPGPAPAAEGPPTPPPSLP